MYHRSIKQDDSKRHGLLSCRIIQCVVLFTIKKKQLAATSSFSDEFKFYLVSL